MRTFDNPGEDQAILERLRLLPALKPLDDHDLEGMISLSRLQTFEPGDVVIKEGQFDNWIYFLMSGKVAILRKGETIGVLQERGDIFGEMGIIDGSPRSATIKAMDRTVCFSMDASYIDRLEGQEQIAFQCVLYQAFAQILANRLRISTDELVRTKAANTALEREVLRLKSGNS